MKISELRVRSRHFATLGAAALVLRSFGTSQVVAKKAPEVTSKRAVASNTMRSIDLKQDGARRRGTFDIALARGF